MSRKLAGIAAEELNDIHRGHCQASAIYHATNISIQLDKGKVRTFLASISEGASTSRSRISAKSGVKKKRMSSKPSCHPEPADGNRRLSPVD